MILVTGGTGLVGSHLLYNLIANGQHVRAIYRREKTMQRTKNVFSYYSENFDALFNKIEWVEADVTDIPKLQIAFKGVTQVYHCAAMVSFEPDKYKILRKINIEGTANIVNLCLSHKIEKLCYVSSIAALGHHSNPEKLIDEDTPWNPEENHSVYAITKYGAELEVWRGAQEGLDVIVVNPGIILGPGYWHGAGSGSFFKRIYNGMPYFTKGVTGYVDIWDLIYCMTHLMQSSIKNEGYVLVAENLTLKDFQSKVAKSLNVKPSKKEAKPWLLALAWRLDWLSHKLLGKRRRLSKQMAKSALSVTKYDNSKVKGAIDFEFNPINGSINRVSSYFLEDLKKNS